MARFNNTIGRVDIIVKNLTKFYGKQKAVDNLSFEVKTGEILGFLGPNGAGKTTTMKAITGYLTPTSGSITIGRYSVTDNPSMVKQVIGYLPEHNPLYTDMNVIDYLRYMAQLQKIRASKINDRILEMVNVCGLEGEKHKRISDLSKGYRQRVGLAQALIHDPQVLILDEPTTGLDPNQIVEIRNLILELGREKTILLSTHIMQEVQAICHQMAILDHGVLVANGSPEQLGNTTDNNHRQVEVEFNFEVDEKMLLQIANIVAVEKKGASTYVLESDSETDVRQDIFNFAVQHNLVVLAMQVKQKSMEEVFQELTKNKH